MATEGSFVVPAGRRLSRVDSKTLRESFSGEASSEMEAVMRNLARKDDKIKYNRRMRVALVAAVGVMVIMVGAMFAVTLSANEATKESHIKGNDMVGLNGKTVHTSAVESYAKLFDLPKFDISTLAQVKHLTLTTHEKLQVTVEITKATKETGSSVAKFYSATGDVITVDGDSHIVLATIDGTCHTVDVTNGDAAMARKLMEEAGEARLYTPEDFFALDDFKSGRKLNKESKMTGFASVALAASEAARDTLQKNSDVDTSFGFSGKVMQTQQKCGTFMEFSAWTAQDKKEHRIETVRETERTVTSFIDGLSAFEFSYKQDSTDPSGWKLSKCDFIQYEEGKNTFMDQVNAVKTQVVSHHGDEFLLKIPEFLVQGRATFGAEADKLITLPDHRECEQINKAEIAANDPDDSKRQLREGRQLSSLNVKTLWWSSQCAYLSDSSKGGHSCGGSKYRYDGSLWKGQAGAKAIKQTIGGKKVIAFAGTDGISDLRDWLSNLNTGKHGNYHKGFYDYQNSLVQHTSLNSQGTFDYCIGHSLGGAAATVYARTSGKCRKVVTFGAPQTRDSGQCGASGRRFLHLDDPITGNGFGILSGFQHDINSAKKVWKNRGSCYCGETFGSCHRSGWWVSCGWRGCKSGYHCNNGGRRADSQHSSTVSCGQRSVKGTSGWSALNPFELIGSIVNFVATVHTKYHDFIPSGESY